MRVCEIAEPSDRAADAIAGKRVDLSSYADLPERVEARGVAISAEDRGDDNPKLGGEPVGEGDEIVRDAREFVHQEDARSQLPDRSAVDDVERVGVVTVGEVVLRPPLGTPCMLHACPQPSLQSVHDADC